MTEDNVWNKAVAFTASELRNIHKIILCPCQFFYSKFFLLVIIKTKTILRLT